MSPHPGPAFFEGRPTPPGELLRHLLAGCSECRLALGVDPVTVCYSEAVREAAGRAEAAAAEVRLRHATAQPRIEELLARPRESWRERIRTDNGWIVPTVAAQFRRLAAERHAEDPHRALALAELAVEAAGIAMKGATPRVLCEEEQAFCLVQLARTQARLGRFAEAEATLRESQKASSIDPYLKAFRYEVRGVLHAQRLEPDPAVAFYDRAAAIYRRFDDWHQVGRLEMMATVAFGDAGRCAEAARRAAFALAFLDAEKEPRLLMGALHNMVFYEAGAGDAELALEDLQFARAFYRAHGQAQDLIRLEWCEARIQLGLGEVDAAEARYEDVCRRFAEAALPMEFASAALEACEAHAAAGHWNRVERMARIALELERALGRETGIVAAWQLLADVTARKIVGVAKVRAALNAVRGATRPR